jgi:hypothetical protein
MKKLPVVCGIALGLIPFLALAQQVPVSPSGTRPGHEVGVGDSLPLSNNASNIEPSDTRSPIAPTLPAPANHSEAQINVDLKAARASLMAGRTGQAQQSLEMVETHVLNVADVNIPANGPISNQLLTDIRAARAALGQGDKTQAIAKIDRALAD